MHFLRMICFSLGVEGSILTKELFVAGHDKVQGNCFGNAASSFLEKERELQSKIEQLEDKVEEFNQSIALQKCWSMTLLNHISVININVLHFKQVDEDKGITTSNDTTSVAEENGVALTLLNSNLYLPGKEAERSTVDDNGDSNLCETLAELSLLKEGNNLMETELKELQQRYSEMSLKFAEVEGERQKLVMTVRNLKNARKAQ
ncbi:uncharacterized protein LOC124824282 [Vigna umbellata]|uniref:uncharacterized protein LOC124824282 n=1 Tax=Vigna umbellata TaxID=87088 RepID=UPI001F5F3285|nr:uncharacterized protein LOC124824282 [Vigna umbellata]